MLPNSSYGRPSPFKAYTMGELSVTVLPPAHTHTVVFLHGRGDNASNFTRALENFRDSRGRTLAEALPTFRWVFPQAPVGRCAANSQSWPQWFDVWDPRDFAAREDLQLDGLRKMVPALRSLLADEAAALGGRWDRVILAGISMGGATSVHALLNLDVPRLGAFLGFCARCPFAGRSLQGMREVLGVDRPPVRGNRTLRNTPVLLEHCADDPTVTIANGRRLRDVLVEFGANVTWREYPTGKHWFKSPEGADDVISFLERVLREG